MSNIVDTAAVQGTANTGTVKGKDTVVDGEAFASELGAQMTEAPSTTSKITSTMERLAQSLSGMTISRGSPPTLGDQPGHFLKNGAQSMVTISDEMLLQMADDEAMFSNVKDMVGSLMTAGTSQALAPTNNSTVTWQNVIISAEETRYIQTSRDNTNFATAVNSLTMKTDEVINSAYDLIFANRNGQSSGSGKATQQQASFNNLVSATETWRFEMAYTRSDQIMETLRSSQSILAQLDVAIAQAEGGIASGEFSLLSYIQSSGLCDPLVLDLGGEGINLTSAEKGVYFDIHGDGRPVQTAWISGNNAFLYLDQNGNGLVDDGNELFGDHGGFANGFDKLAQYDSNGDGIIDSNDEIYSQLRLWRDLNSDGVNQADESMSLEEAGIKSINLRYNNGGRLDAHGNVIGETSNFTWADGRQGAVADAWFKTIKR